MSVERAIEDQRLMEQVLEPSTWRLMRSDLDIIIIGSGAGGGTMAHALSDTGARILILERGDFVPQEEENWSPEAVWKQLRYRTRSAGWTSAAGSFFRTRTTTSAGIPSSGEACCSDCAEKISGAVEHVDGVSPAWPIDYDTLAPFYERAERLYQVRGAHGVDPTEAPRGAFPRAAVPHRPAWRTSSSSSRPGPASLPAAARPS